MTSTKNDCHDLHEERLPWPPFVFNTVEAYNRIFVSRLSPTKSITANWFRCGQTRFRDHTTPFYVCSQAITRFEKRTTTQGTGHDISSPCQRLFFLIMLLLFNTKCYLDVWLHIQRGQWRTASTNIQPQQSPKILITDGDFWVPVMTISFLFFFFFSSRYRS